MDNTEFQLSDEEIVAMTLREHSSFGFIIERYEAKLKLYIGRLGVRNYDDQADVMQEIFIKAYRNLNSFDTSLSFSSWIYRIAHNEAVSWYRRQSVRPEGHLITDGEDVLNLISSKEEAAEITFDKNVNASELTKALEEIELKYREVLILRYF